MCSTFAQGREGFVPWIRCAEQERESTMLLDVCEVYEELLKPFGGKLPKRIKTAVAAAAELGDVQVGTHRVCHVKHSGSFADCRS